METTEEIINRIRKNDSDLEVVNLSHRNLTLSQMCSLSEALKVNKLLQTLWLRGNNLGNYPKGMKFLSEALKVNNTSKCWI